jgi:hypothetical protein
MDLYYFKLFCPMRSLAICLMAVALWSQLLACVRGVQGVEPLIDSMPAQVRSRSGPSSLRTLEQTPSAEPSAQPTAQPSAPSANVFPYTTGTLTNTDSASQNYVSLQQYACPGDFFTFSTCSVLAPEGLRDTYIRLLLDDLAENNNYVDTTTNTTFLCSRIDYTQPRPSCGTLDLRLGCYANTSCQMTATVEEIPSDF